MSHHLIMKQQKPFSNVKNLKVDTTLHLAEWRNQESGSSTSEETSLCSLKGLSLVSRSQSNCSRRSRSPVFRDRADSNCTTKGLRSEGKTRSRRNSSCSSNSSVGYIFNVLDARDALEDNSPKSDCSIYTKKLSEEHDIFSTAHKISSADLRSVRCLVDCAPTFTPVPSNSLEIFNTIAEINSTLMCDHTERDLTLKTLHPLCVDNSPVAEDALREAADDVVVFLYATFLDVLARNVGEEIEEEMDKLEMIIRIVGVIALKSPFFLDKLLQHMVLQRMTDEIVHRTSPEIVEHLTVQHITGVILQSQLLVALTAEMAAVLQSILDCCICDSGWQAMDLSSVFAAVLMLNTVSDLLFSYREVVRTYIGQVEIGTEKGSSLLIQSISQLASQCDRGSTVFLCSHAVKIVIMLIENFFLKHKLVTEHASALSTVSAALLAFDETSVEDITVKFWLVRRLCSDPDVRNIVFCTEGALAMILRVMRAVTLNMGALSVLAPFCDDSFFQQDSVLHISEVIKYLWQLFRHGSSSRRRHASNLLMAFAVGLYASCSCSDGISKCFTDAGVLLGLLELLEEEITAGDAEWRERGTLLLCALMVDDALQQQFLGEPLFFLHTLVKSHTSYLHKSTAFAALIQVILVVIVDHRCHARLFDSNVILDLVEHIKETQTASDSTVSESVKTEQVYDCLRIFESLAASRASRVVMREMKLDDFLKHLALHGRKAVCDIANGILDQMFSLSTRKPV